MSVTFNTSDPICAMTRALHADLGGGTSGASPNQPDQEEIAEGVSNELSNDRSGRGDTSVDADGLHAAGHPCCCPTVTAHGFDFGTKRPRAWAFACLVNQRV